MKQELDKQFQNKYSFVALRELEKHTYRVPVRSDPGVASLQLGAVLGSGASGVPRIS